MDGPRQRVRVGVSLADGLAAGTGCWQHHHAAAQYLTALSRPVFVAQGGGALPSSNSAGSLAVMAMPSPPYMSPAGSPSPPKVLQQPPPMSDTQRPGSGSAKQIRVEAAATIRVSTAPAAVLSPVPQAAYSGHAMPDPPAPRCWTPSKLGSSGGAAQVCLGSRAQHGDDCPYTALFGAHEVLPSTSSACHACRLQRCLQAAGVHLSHLHISLNMLLPLLHLLTILTPGGSGTTTRSMTPAEALEKEMQELSCSDPGSAAVFAQQQHPHSSNTTSGISSYRNPHFESAHAQLPAAARAGMGLRPASSSGAPFTAQHNNLMSPMSPKAAGSWRPGSTGSNRPSREELLPTQLALTKPKTKLCVQTLPAQCTHAPDARAVISPVCGALCPWSRPPLIVGAGSCRVGRGNEPGVTAVEAFSEPDSIGVVASDSNDPVVVARRRGTAPARYVAC